MPDRIRLSPCPSCQTAIPVSSAVCPECGARQPGHSPWGSMARAFLGPRLGCLVTVLLLAFGPALLVGLLAGDVLGALGWALLGVGGLGLALTTWLIWLVRPTRRRDDP